MPLATMAHPTVGTLNFLMASTPTGWPIDVANAAEEELTSPGVDSKRWRTTSQQETEITMTTLADSTTYAGVITIAQAYLRCKSGDPVTITVSISGTTYRFRNVHVLDVQPQTIPGAVVGTGATVSSAAHVIAQWRLILMDTAVTGEIG
jgi:hypothetical protein